MAIVWFFHEPVSYTHLLFPTPSIHRLQCGLPGYLILFAPHTFVPQCQLPVSYTHLDVYKRQKFPYRAANISINFIQSALQPSALPTELKRNI